MRVLVAGGTGVIGSQLLPLLGEVGHEVIVMARPANGLEVPGAQVVTADALDRRSVNTAVRSVAPDAVVNLLTAIPRVIDPRHFAQQMSMTNRLRSQGTANLVDAARGARLVSAGLAYAYEPAGGPVADESRPLWLDGPKPFVPAVRALVELEERTTEAGGAVLRLGHLYGPGTGFAEDGAFFAQLATGRAPIVGTGSAMFSFLHTHDAATAVVAALDKPVSGALNVVDDDPAYVRDWLPEWARIIGAPHPKHVPVALARLTAGAWGVAYMNRIVGADNSLARFSLDWRPRFPTWRTGFESERSAGHNLGPTR